MHLFCGFISCGQGAARDEGCSWFFEPVFFSLSRYPVSEEVVGVFDEGTRGHAVELAEEVVAGCKRATKT